ncbi:Hypothetical protein LCAKO_2391 [Lacticaseibacillus paracasei subsp. paracasei]|uniref:Uncharacterized protein n=1 Tax=Lacticaseibacillus paracasei subsp. paracasei TaxID=47714 RepID=A0AAP9KWA3_LACPA|nr:Hypothetical protein LCAKO_2391 [Lacticaseibacillus paracasei subsp. paracasei]
MRSTRASQVDVESISSRASVRLRWCWSRSQVDVESISSRARSG